MTPYSGTAIHGRLHDWHTMTMGNYCRSRWCSFHEQFWMC